MSNTKIVWWLLLAGWMAGSTWWHVCKIKQICDSPLITNSQNNSASAETFHSSGKMASPLHIMDGPGLMLTSPGNFEFDFSAEKASLTGVSNELDSLVAYLRQFPDRKLNIKGYYSSTEKNNTQWDNLGIARAENVKSYLVKLGISPERLTTTGEIDDNLLISGNKVYGGIGFEFENQSEVNERSLATAQKFKDIFKPLDLYFPSGSADYIKTTDNANFLLEAKKFLSEHPDKKLLITGHTDNTGTAELNATLSKERAEVIKKVFIAYGIPAKQLATDAKGQMQPKASNETEAGKSANRRVTIVIL